MRNSIYFNFFKEQRDVFRGETLSVIGLFIVILFIILAIFGPYITPYEAHEAIIDEFGLVPDNKMPSSKHYFGLTRFGYDIFSQTILSTRTAVIVGLVSAIMVVFVGVNL